VNLSASDNCPGVTATEYSIDGGANWIAYTNSFSVSNEGVTNIQYRSTDRAGNVETIKNLTIQIDKSAPTISLTANQLPFNYAAREAMRFPAWRASAIRLQTNTAHR